VEIHGQQTFALEHSDESDQKLCKNQQKEYE
jgi:hypothetical protein